MTDNENANVFFSRIKEDKYLLVCFQFQSESFKIDDYCSVVAKLTTTADYLLNKIVICITNKVKELKDAGGALGDVDDESISAKFYSNDCPVSADCLCMDLPFWVGDEMHLRIGSVRYNIVLNGPCVDEITLPRVIIVGFPISPFTFKTSYTNVGDCDFLWYRKKQGDFELIGNGYSYTPTTEDVGCILKLICIPGNGDLKGPKVETVSKKCVKEGPKKFPFEDRHIFTQTGAAPGSFRIMTYNILADFCAGTPKLRKERFPYCPPHALNINYRKQLLQKEIIGYNVDIMCLQEVDKSVYQDHLLPLLSTRYNGTFKVKGTKITEGLACFYDKSKFRLKEQHGITLAHELQINPRLRNLWTLMKPEVEKIPRFLKAATSLQIAVLISLEEEDNCVIIANTHLRSWPEPDYFRALQASVALAYLQSVVGDISKKMPEKKIATILCGDFNSTPDSCVYELMVNQSIGENHPCWSEEENKDLKGINLSHSFNFGSAYGTPDFTNYTHDFIGCLDYIFHQKDALQILQIVPLPHEEEVKEHEAIPSVVFPSDHLALIADLCWT
ncbi:2',5'-phosphodiesterase 12-like isoform X1 [Schistocerca cancellata]|uniref:2',5'-phosphodiesterase 12-like isoform X1 n=1 Tax=Schistocerca cancellata TaxID=274614 RepID=UPI002117E89F|nr:2',5'-phosphodiesterase 12-like isoform X1 [Schistocerca cancellata]